MKWFLALASFSSLAVAACAEQSTSQPAEGHSYWLTEVNGVPFDEQASIRFDAEGTVSGAGPCNGYGAALMVSPPGFELGPIRATRRACLDMRAESRFFGLLPRMTTVAVQGPVLTLSNSAGETMVFQLPSE